MLWNDFHFYSRALQIQTAAYVLLPDMEIMQQHPQQKVPTLYLLHGLSDDHTAWLYKTRIAEYARKYHIAVVMPAANRSFYADMAHGGAYWSFISKELPEMMETYFPLSSAREHRFAAGLSMGGYGAMKLGLLMPDRFGAIAALSAPLMMQEAFAEGVNEPEWLTELENIFGNDALLRAGAGNLARAAEALDPASAPKMYVACGTDDFLYEANQAFIAQFKDKFGIHYTTEEGIGHTWDYWDPQIKQVLAWLPLTKHDEVW